MKKSMDIYSKRGSMVLITKETAHNGYDSDKEQVEKNLEIGKLYTIRKIEVHSSSSTVWLVEFPNLTWNSVNFINYVPKPTEEDFREELNGSGQLTLNVEAFNFAMRKWLRENEDQIQARKMYKEGVVKLSDSEMIVTNIAAYNKNANGCLRHRKHVMLTYTKEGSETFYDLFLDKDQAIHLLDLLTKSLGDNE